MTTSVQQLPEASKPVRATAKVPGSVPPPGARHAADPDEESIVPLLAGEGRQIRSRRAPSRLRLGPWLRPVVICLVALASVGTGLYLLRQRSVVDPMVDLGTVMLTAQAIGVGSAEAVVVDSVAVEPESKVEEGTRLAWVVTADGDREVLVAPGPGRVAQVLVGVGGVARAGEPVVTLYDERGLTFQTQVSADQLRRLRLGMTARIDGPGLTEPVGATLDRVVPVVSAGPDVARDRLTVVLVPEPSAARIVANLVPGLPYHAVIDTRTATGSVPAVNTGD